MHNDVYDSQLALVLPANSITAGFDEDSKELLSELEGALQVRTSRYIYINIHIYICISLISYNSHHTS